MGSVFVKAVAAAKLARENRWISRPVAATWLVPPEGQGRQQADGQGRCIDEP